MSWVYLLRHFSTASYGIHWRPWKNLSTIASVRSAQAPEKGFTACSKLLTPSIIIILSNPNNTLLWANHSKLPYMFDFPNIGPSEWPLIQQVNFGCYQKIKWPQRCVRVANHTKNDGISPVPPKASFHGHQRTTGKQPTKSIMNMPQKRIHAPNLFVEQKDLQRLNLVLCMNVHVCLSVSLSVRTYVHMYVCTYTYMHESQVSFMQPNEILVSSKFLSAGPIPVLPARPNSLLRPSIQQWNCSIFLKTTKKPLASLAVVSPTLSRRSALPLSWGRFHLALLILDSIEVQNPRQEKVGWWCII